MKELLIKILLFIFTFFMTNVQEISPVQGPASVTWLNQKSDYDAGEDITLKFQGNLSDPELIWDSGYGITLFTASRSNDIFSFDIPSEIATKSGLVKWELTEEGVKKADGELRIKPAQQIEKIEVYAGPTDLFAGGNDKAMIVAIPMDEFGNTVLDSSKVDLNTNYEGKWDTEALLVRDNFTFKRITSPNRAGRMTFSLQSSHSSTKEIIVDINPGLPSDFNISYEQSHPYADGNELTTIVTSVIIDPIGNIIADGTLVHFIIKNSELMPLSVSGQTINGIARAQILHPEEEEIYSIQAQVSGLAKSNTVELNFIQAVRDFNLIWKENEKELLLGPILSYMDQWIPDGFGIKIRLLKDGDPIFTMNGQSLKGHCRFNLKNKDIPPGSYDLEVEAAGLLKRIKNVEL